MDIRNQIVIVTGAASGMGEATARHLAKAQAKIALLDRNVHAAKKIADEIHGIAIECDVSNEQSVKAALQQCEDKLGVARICISCAGIINAARLVGRDGAMSLADFKKIIDVNLIGTFNVMRLVAERMTKLNPLADGERGVIINTASIAAYEGQIGQVAYSASKGGVVSMTLPAARDLAKFAIRVMTIAPGLMDTPMAAGFTEEVRQSLAESVPFPARLGQPDEFAALALHIIENSYLNGGVIRLDGALRMAPK